jgi:hypothetical protein
VSYLETTYSSKAFSNFQFYGFFGFVTHGCGCLHCRSWGTISLIVAYFWQLYTLWILVRLHEAVPGRRYNRYVELAQAAFGETCSQSFILPVHGNKF